MLIKLFARSVQVKGAEDLTDNLKPNQLQSVRQPESSQRKSSSPFQETAWVGKANSKLLASEESP